MQRSIYLIHGIFHSFLNPQIHQGVTECPPHVEFHRQIINPLKSFNSKEQIKIYLNYAIHKIITINVKKNCKLTVADKMQQKLVIRVLKYCPTSA